MKTITLLQPRHIYAPDPAVEEIGHIYMPTSLLTAAARLIEAGAVVDLHDENLSECPLDNDVVGANLLGAPYVQRIRELCDRIARKGSQYTLILGGQVISGFLPKELSLLFGKRAVNGNDDGTLASVVGADVRDLPSPQRTSLVPAYDLIDDASMRIYLEQEFGFFLSQGCKFSCTFCAAQRTRQDPLTGKRRVVRETYRDAHVIELDLMYLAERAMSLGIRKLKLYLTNLDLFQTPKELTRFVEVVTWVRKVWPEISFEMRGLSTASSFLEVHRSRPSLIHRLAELGLRRVGFGVDGGAAEIWKATRKPQSGSMCIDAIATARETYGLTPETLMVFGHYGLDTEKSLTLAVEFTRAMWAEYGSLPRPHVAKSVVPGNDGWYSVSSRKAVDDFLTWLPGFQSLDFTALPSHLTHPDREFREMATKHYLEVCGLEGAATRYVLPELQDMTEEELQRVREFNLRRYDI